MDKTAGELTTICPLRLTMDIIGGKWKLSIICLLSNGQPMRYNQIKRGVPGITNVMLAQSLKSFEQYGIVHREQYNEVPVRVEYQLAQNGLELLSALNLLHEWGTKYISGRKDLRSHCPTCLFNENSTNIIPPLT